MILTDLSLTNFRLHRKLNLKFDTGITGIVGENGVGKSSIIEAILFLFTGELFKDNRQEAITLGESSGYVSGRLEHEGKEIRIERHLDISSVRLVYDGVTYKKATEVKELWDKLLQINNEIVSRVLIARQNDIPLLFSGESSIREKIFQKIFLVPNTEKIRNTLYKNYIKQCPLVIPVEDLIQLNGLKENLEEQLITLQAKVDDIVAEANSEDELTEFRARILFLNKCKDDSVKINMLTESLNALMVEEKDLKTKVDEFKGVLSTFNIKEYEKQFSDMMQQKGLYQQRLRIEQKLEALAFPCNTETIDQMIKLQGSLREQIEGLTEKRSLAKQVCVDIEKYLDDHANLDGKTICNECGQDIHFIAELIAQKKEELENKRECLLELNKKITNTTTELREANDLVNNYNKVALEQLQLEKAKQELASVLFDPTQLEEVKEVIEAYRDYEKDYQDVLMQYERIKNKIRIGETQLDSLAVYDGDTTIMAELDELALVISHNTDLQRALQQLRIDIRVKEAELKNLQARIKTSEENSEKNAKRNRYFDILNQVYDVLHSSNFPRKLILNYADIVTEYLQEHLKKFKIPYSAKVSDNFKVEMVDAEGRTLPSVSGGQEVIVGISLHIALHELFSQDFPMMIIDEGSAALSSINKKCYFNIIQGLRDMKKLTQIIVIDHDSQLAEVVDNTIDLGGLDEED